MLEAQQPEADNNDKAVFDYIARELVAAGFILGSELGKQRDQGDDVHKLIPSYIINSLFLLLQQRQKDADVREELSDRLRRVSTDYDILSTTLSKTKAKVEACEREKDVLQMKIESSEKSLKEMTSQYNSAKEDLRVTKVTLQQTKAQFQHEIRKKEREQEKWKEKQTNSHSTASKGKNDVVNSQQARILNPLRSITNATSSRTNTTSNSQNLHNPNGNSKTKNDDIYAIVIKTYEDREKEVLSENEDLRETLYRIYCMLRDRHAECARLRGDETAADNKDRSAQFRLPLNLARQSLAQLILDAMEGVRHEFQILLDKCGEYEALTSKESENKKEAPPASQIAQVKVDSRELDYLKRQLGECQHIIEEQNRLLNLSLAPDDVNHNSDSNPAYKLLETTQQDVDSQMEELRRQREQLDLERRRFTDAAVKLGVERVTLEREREEFEEGKRMLETQKVLSVMPSTPNWLRPQQHNTQSSSGPPSVPTRIPSGLSGMSPIDRSGMHTSNLSNPSMIKSVLKKDRSYHPLLSQGNGGRSTQTCSDGASLARSEFNSKKVVINENAAVE
ncbi:hypothetical protein SeLEV6574_g04769 [Synchytrium endobioticum]|nr:hypothetical protein SeLEV6574_g04769 [Synchytrium endobioticum]